MPHILLTGAAGFVGFHAARALLARGDRVTGIDNFNDYYEVSLKEARAAQLAGPGFTLHRADIADKDTILALVQAEPTITHIVHLAAQAGVRYSMVNPYAYVQANVMGHLVMLEAARLCPALQHFVYASSSSVYGLSPDMPLRETAPVNHPTSLYAATKRADELMSAAYSHLYQLPQTGLRFFTVYGPWGRPDMAYYSFARAIRRGEPITLYEGGTLKRDFTYIDDIIDGVLRVIEVPPPAFAPRILNIGNHRSELVTHLVQLLETELKRKAIVYVTPKPAADVIETFASVDEIGSLTGYRPATPLDGGIPKFVEWLIGYDT